MSLIKVSVDTSDLRNIRMIASCGFCRADVHKRTANWTGVLNTETNHVGVPFHEDCADKYCAANS